MILQATLTVYQLWGFVSAGSVGAVISMVGDRM